MHIDNTNIVENSDNELNVFIMTLHSDDHSRVVLSVPDEDGSDYINASFIDVSNDVCFSLT